MEFQSEQDCVTRIKNLPCSKAKIHCGKNDAHNIEASCSNADKLIRVLNGRNVYIWSGNIHACRTAQHGYRTQSSG